MFCVLECCSKYWVPNNMTELDLRLKEQLMGQPLAHDLIFKSISSHINTEHPSKALVLSLHGSTGTGKNFVAKHIVESLYRKGYKSKYARLYVASRDFMHQDEEHLKQYKDRIKHDIERATSGCQYATFIFDEVDKMPMKLLETILFYIDFHTPTYAQPIDFRKTIFIFLSNTGGKEINTIAHNNHFASIERNNYNITEFQRALANAAFSEPGGLWHASLINRHLVTFFVPFLPLERSHIRTCIQRQLELIHKKDKYQYILSDNDITDRVLDLIEFSPPNSLLYSVSGCKKVQQKLDFILESNRVIPTKKPIEEF
ncbi:unnamed protein product [Rotaria sordida]|uniref:Torsin-1A C-terminal domain-containing protein n=2 Tax=Rotaria sordida TaxID=392033 RepID=A0A814LA26_9BILA|nr:unnamed protein product [Rotaria sordida]